MIHLLVSQLLSALFRLETGDGSECAKVDGGLDEGVIERLLSMTLKVDQFELQCSVNAALERESACHDLGAGRFYQEI